MNVLVNDAPRALPAGTTVADLVLLLGIGAGRCAVERNRVLVRRADHAATVLAEGDRVEVVTLVGGG
jgi:sulfur carrier protein